MTLTEQQWWNGAPVSNDPINLSGLCLGVSIDQKVAAQFQNTLDNAIYITPFGDLPGDVALKFLLNPACGATTSQAENFLSEYYFFRLRPSYYTGPGVINRSPNVLVSIGSSQITNFYGYVVGCQLTASTGSSVLIEGTMIIKAWKISGT
jgi:hypothetical protein